MSFNLAAALGAPEDEEVPPPPPPPPEQQAAPVEQAPVEQAPAPEPQQTAPVEQAPVEQAPAAPLGDQVITGVADTGAGWNEAQLGPASPPPPPVPVEQAPAAPAGNGFDLRGALGGALPADERAADQPAEDVPPPAPPPPPGPFTGAVDSARAALGEAAAPIMAAAPEPVQNVGDALGQAAGGATDVVTGVTTALGHGDVNTAFTEAVGGLSGPQTQTITDVTERLQQGIGAIPDTLEHGVEQVMADPSNIPGIYGGLTTTYGPAPAYYGITYEDWWDQNPARAQALVDEGGPMAAHEQWLTDMGASSVPPPTWTNPRDAVTSLNPLEAAGQFLGALPQAAQGVGQSVQQGTFGPFAINMLQQIVEDPTTLTGKFTEPLGEAAVAKTIAGAKKLPGVGGLFELSEGSQKALRGEEMGSAAAEQIYGLQAGIEEPPGWGPAPTTERVPTPPEGLPPATIHITPDGTRIEERPSVMPGGTPSYRVTKADGTGSVDYSTFDQAMGGVRASEQHAYESALAQQKIRDTRFTESLKDTGGKTEPTHSPLSGVRGAVDTSHPLYKELTHTFQQSGLGDYTLKIVPKLADYLGPDTLSAIGRGNPSALTDPVRKTIVVALDHARNADYEDLGLTPADSARLRIKTDLDHEIVHAMDNLGLFTASERTILLDAANAHNIPSQMSGFYQKLPPAQREAEMIAHLYQFYREGKLLKDSPAAPILERMRAFLVGLGRGLKNTYPEEILRNIEEGNYGVGKRSAAVLNETEPSFSARTTTRPGAQRLGISLADRSPTPGAISDSDVRTALRDSARPFNMSRDEYQRLAGSPEAALARRRQLIDEGYDAIVVWDGQGRMGVGGSIDAADVGRVDDVLTFADPNIDKVQFNLRPESEAPERMRQAFRSAGIHIGEQDPTFIDRFRFMLNGLSQEQIVATMNRPFMDATAPKLADVMARLGRDWDEESRARMDDARVFAYGVYGQPKVDADIALARRGNAQEAGNINALKAPSMDTYDAMLRQAMGHLLWYDLSGLGFDDVGLTVHDTRDLVDLTAATSGGEVPLSNQRLSLAMKSEQLRGRAGWVGMRSTAAVEGVLQGKGLFGPKFNNFARNLGQQTMRLRGTLPAEDLEALPTVDMWHFRAYNTPTGIGGGSDALYTMIAHHTISEAAALQEALGEYFNDIGGRKPTLEHRFAQAGVWVLGRENEGFDVPNPKLVPFEHGSDYWSALNIIRNELDESFPEGNFANRSLEYRDFLHPRFANELVKYGIQNYEQSRHGMLEAATDNTVAGQQLKALMHNLRRLPPGTTVRHLGRDIDVWDAVLNGRAYGGETYKGIAKIAEGAFKSLTEGDNSPLAHMVQGITGIDDLKISRILRYNLGSWGGVVSSNVDIPLYGRTGAGDLFMLDREAAAQLMSGVSHAFYQDGAAWNKWNTAIEPGTGNAWILESPYFHTHVSSPRDGVTLSPQAVDALTGIGQRLGYATATASAPNATQIRLIPTETTVHAPVEAVAQAIRDLGLGHLEFEIKEAKHESAFAKAHAEFGYADEFNGAPISRNRFTGRGEDPRLVGAGVARPDGSGSLRQRFDDALVRARTIADRADSDTARTVNGLRPLIERALGDTGQLWDAPPEINQRIAELESIGGKARNFPVNGELDARYDSLRRQFALFAGYDSVGEEYGRILRDTAPPTPHITAGVPVSDAAKVHLDAAADGALHFRDGWRPVGNLRDIATKVYGDVNTWIQGFDRNGNIVDWAQNNAEWRTLNKRFNPDGKAKVLDMTYGAGDARKDTAHARARADYAVGIMQDATQRGARDITKRGPIGAALAEYTNAMRTAMLFNVLNAPRYVLQNLSSNTLNVIARGGGVGVASEIFTDFGEMGRVFRAQKDVAARSHLDSILHEAKVGDRPNMRQSARSYLGQGTSDVNRSAIGKGIDRAVRLVAPETLRYLMSVPDILAREKVGTHAIYQGFGELNPQLPGMLERHLRAQGISHLIPQERLHTVMTEFLDTKRHRMDLNTGLPETTMSGKIARYEPVWAADDLKAHLIENLTKDLPTKPDPGQLNRALNDFQHTTKNEVRGIVDRADAQVDHALFSWRDTQGDELLKKVFLYHYWSSRQGGFYVAEGLKRPYLIAAYGRMMTEMNQQAEELGAPDWMKGWFQFMGSPAGVSVWYSPFDTIGSLLTMADWQTGEDPNPFEDLTELGRKWKAMPFLVHPALTMVAYATGMLGPDFKAPMLTGTETMTSRGIDLLNLANASDAAFMAPFNAMGIGVDASGNKIPLARKPLQDLYASVGNAISSALAPITHLAPVEVVPSTGAIDANIISIGEAEVRRQHPEWDDGSKAGQMWINRTVTDTIDDPGSDLYQSWYRMAAKLPFEIKDGMPLPLQALVRLASPIQIRATPEQQVLDQMEGLQPKGDMSMRGPVDPFQPDASYIWDEAHYGRYASVESRRLNEWKNEFFGLVDPALKDTRSTANAISMCKDADTCYLSKDITIGTATYTPTDIQKMDDAHRKTLRADFVSQSGTTEEEMQTVPDTQNRYLADHPDLAAYMQWDDLIRQAPGANEAEKQKNFSLQLAAENPSFDQYLRSSMTDHITGVTDYSKVKYGDAFQAAQGVRPTVYSPTVGNEPSYAPGGYPAIPGVEPGQPILPRANAITDIPLYAKSGDVSQHWYADPPIATVSPEFPLLILQQNDDGTVLVAEYTQPDRPIGFVDGHLIENTSPVKAVSPGMTPVGAGVSGGGGFGNPFDALGAGIQAAGSALGGLFAPQQPPPTRVDAAWQFSRPAGTFDHTAINSIDTDTYSGSTNYNMRNAPPEGIVYHFTAGNSIGGFAADFLGQTGRKASSNYVVDKDGSIYQFVSPDDAAWAHGDTSSPNQYGQLLVNDGYGDANQTGISIEIVNEGNASNPGSGNPKDFVPYTNQQLEAVQNLTNYLCWTYGIPPDRSHLIGHSDINTTGKSDPGPLFPLETIIANAYIQR